MTAPFTLQQAGDACPLSASKLRLFLQSSSICLSWRRIILLVRCKTSSYLVIDGGQHVGDGGVEWG